MAKFASKAGISAAIPVGSNRSRQNECVGLTVVDGVEQGTSAQIGE